MLFTCHFIYVCVCSIREYENCLTFLFTSTLPMAPVRYTVYFILSYCHFVLIVSCSHTLVSEYIYTLSQDILNWFSNSMRMDNNLITHTSAQKSSSSGCSALVCIFDSPHSGETSQFNLSFSNSGGYGIHQKQGNINHTWLWRRSFKKTKIMSNNFFSKS